MRNTGASSTDVLSTVVSRSRYACPNMMVVPSYVAFRSPMSAKKRIQKSDRACRKLSELFPITAMRAP